MDCMFYYCSSLEKLKFPNINIYARDIFYECPYKLSNKYDRKESKSGKDFSDLNDDDDI